VEYIIHILVSLQCLTRLENTDAVIPVWLIGNLSITVSHSQDSA